MWFPLLRRLAIAHDAGIASAFTKHSVKIVQVLMVPRRLKSKGRAPEILAPHVSGQQSNQIRPQANRGQPQEIVGSLSKLKQSPDARSVTAALSACFKAKKYDKAHALFFAQERSVLNLQVFRTMITLSERTGRYRDSVRFLKLMQKKGLQPDVVCLSSAIHAWIKLGDWQQALETFKSMESLYKVSPNIFSYNLALKACAIGGDSSAALTIFKRLCDDARVRPDIVTLNSVINACASDSLTDQATGILMSMKQRHGIEPNCTSFNAAIRAFEKGGQWQKAREFVEVMEALGLKPNVVTFTSIIKSCARVGASEDALETFNTLKEKSILPNEYAVNSVLDALSHETYTAEVIDIMQDARNAGLYPKAWASSSEVDLHRLSVSVSCAILRIIFLELKSGVRKISDILIITGRGNNSDGNAILQVRVLKFISAYRGPKITKDPRNPGAFSLKATNITLWLKSRATEPT